MSKYLFIESRDPFESCDSSMLHELAIRQADEGNDVTIFLIQIRKERPSMSSPRML